MFTRRTFTISDWRCSGSSFGGQASKIPAWWPAGRWDWEAALLPELDLALPVSSEQICAVASWCRWCYSGNLDERRIQRGKYPWQDGQLHQGLLEWEIGNCTLVYQSAWGQLLLSWCDTEIPGLMCLLCFFASVDWKWYNHESAHQFCMIAKEGPKIQVI